MNLPPRQQDCYDIICAYWKEHGRSPTIPILADKMQIATPTAKEHVKALIERGEIEQGHNERRALYPRGLKRHIKEYF